MLPFFTSNWYSKILFPHHMNFSILYVGFYYMLIPPNHIAQALPTFITYSMTHLLSNLKTFATELNQTWTIPWCYQIKIPHTLRISKFKLGSRVKALKITYYLDKTYLRRSLTAQQQGEGPFPANWTEVVACWDRSPSESSDTLELTP